MLSLLIPVSPLDEHHSTASGVHTKDPTWLRLKGNVIGSHSWKIHGVYTAGSMAGSVTQIMCSGICLFLGPIFLWVDLIVWGASSWWQVVPQNPTPMFFQLRNPKGKRAPFLNSRFQQKWEEFSLANLRSHAISYTIPVVWVISVFWLARVGSCGHPWPSKFY